MGYYADTTKKLMQQIGQPYEYTKSQGLDLSSLLMALMFMPQKGKTVISTPSLPAGQDLSWAMKEAPGIGILPPEIISLILGGGIPSLPGVIR